jgi:hypothetical protein
MTTSELVDYYVVKVHRGEITFDKVRPELVQRGMSENEIKEIVRLVDEELRNRMLSGPNSSKRLIVGGTVVLTIGLIITISAYLGLFSAIRAYIGFGYVPILAGISMIISGLRRRKGKDTKFGSRIQNEEKS